MPGTERRSSSDDTSTERPAGVTRRALLSGGALALGALGLTMRSFVRSMRVARTLADLEGADSLSSEHVAEALSYRALDRIG